MDVRAAAELQTLAAADGVELIVVAHAPAATLAGAPSAAADYHAARLQYFETLAEALGARLVYTLDDFWVPLYAVLDSTHLNLYGAELYAGSIASAMLGGPATTDGTLPPYAVETPNLTTVGSADDSMSGFAAVVLRATPGLGTTLHVRYVHNHAVPPLPAGQLYLALRLPDGTDQISPATQVGESEFAASFPGLGQQSNLVVLARLEEWAGGRFAALRAPLAGYHWSSE